MKNNKPEWLLKAEEEQAKFNETKIGKMTEKAYAQYEGGITRSKGFTSKYQSNTAKKNSYENKMKAASKGGSITGITKRALTIKWKQELYDMITLKEFTVYDIEKYINEFPNMSDLQMFRLWLRDISKYEVVGIRENNKSGANPKIYKKVETNKNL